MPGRAATARSSATTAQNASTTAGSNWVPAQRRSSASAALVLRPALYGRTDCMASKESQTVMILAPSGIASPASPSG